MKSYEQFFRISSVLLCAAAIVCGMASNSHAAAPLNGEAAPMLIARQGHAATVLPDGTVLVAGGIGCDGSATTHAEIYDPKPTSGPKWKP